MPTVFVIFGITGDLANRKIIPALLALHVKTLLPVRFAILGFSRKSFTDDEFRSYLRAHLILPAGAFSDAQITEFLDNVFFQHGAYDNTVSYRELSERITKIETVFGARANKIFHLSVPPTTHHDIISALGTSGLSTSTKDAWTRILIEKPFGTDTKTAHALNKLLLRFFTEEQIFRIDHYLAKESLQHFPEFHFPGGSLEPFWNRTHIEKVHIQLLETAGVENRGEFYDGVGALRDVVQNHMLEMLALTAMKKPRSENAKDVRAARAKVLKCLAPVKNGVKQVTRGQYEHYAQEAGVAPQSRTETYVRLEAFLKLWRFRGVPFLLETGKRMKESRTSIDVYFKHDIPGMGKVFSFDVKRKTNSGMLSDYERIIHDALLGVQTLFASQDEVMAEWKFITPILKHWNSLPLMRYTSADIVEKEA